MSTIAQTLPHGVILAGGQARRFDGQDKALLDLMGRPLIAHVIAAISNQCTALAINSSNALSGISEEITQFSDTLTGQLGPLAGVHAALSWARAQGATHCLTVACDMPFLPGDLVAQLSQSSEDAQIVLAADHQPDGALFTHPTVGLWHVDQLAPLEEAISQGMRKMMGYVATQPHDAVVLASTTPAPLFNINTPADLERAHHLS